MGTQLGEVLLNQTLSIQLSQLRNLSQGLLAIAVCIMLQISAANIAHDDKNIHYLIDAISPKREWPALLESHYSHALFQFYLSS